MFYSYDSKGLIYNSYIPSIDNPLIAFRRIRDLKRPVRYWKRSIQKKWISIDIS